MKQILVIPFFFFCFNALSQSINDTASKNNEINNNNLYFKGRIIINSDSLKTLLKKFDSTVSINTGTVEYKLKNVGDKINKSTLFITLAKVENKYRLRANYWYYNQNNGLFILNYILKADSQTLNLNLANPQLIQWNGKKISVYQHLTDKMTYDMLIKMANAKDAEVYCIGQQNNAYTFQLNKSEKKNIIKVFELLNLLAER